MSYIMSDESLKGLISIIIPTLNRKDYLINTLNDITKQDYPIYEIIVVDQGKTLGLEQTLHAYKNLHYIHLPKPNLIKALNTGWKKASGEICLFTDDDVQIIDKDFLSSHVKNYQDSTIGAIVGAIFLVGQSEPFKLPEQSHRAKPKWYFYPRLDLDVRTEAYVMQGPNLSVRKETLKKIGGVDENFIKNAFHWETDLMQRVKNSGYKAMFDNAAKLHHFGGLEGGCENGQLYDKENAFPVYFMYFFRNSIYYYLKHEKKYFLFLFKRLLLDYIFIKPPSLKNISFISQRLIALTIGLARASACYIKIGFLKLISRKSL